MFTRVFVPLDGSSRAKTALPIAARIARASGGTVVLAQVVDDARLRIPFLPQEWARSHSPQDLTATRDYLAEIAHSAVLAGIHSESVALTGRTTQALLDAIDAQQVDLVVMTSHGRTLITRWALGSIAQHLIRSAGVPVLVLREPEPFGGRPDPTDRMRVLAPLDGSAYAEAALAPAVALISALAPPRALAIHLALVLPLYEDEIDAHTTLGSLMLEGVTGYLQNVTNRLHSWQPEMIVTWSVSSDLDVATVLIRGAQLGEFGETGELAWSGETFRHCDLVAMSTYGSGGAGTWTLGSVTERMLQATTLPILVVRPQATATT